MRNTIISGLIVLSSILSLNAQNLPWGLETMTSQNCTGCYNKALAANQIYVDKVVKTLKTYALNASDSSICASFESYFQSPSTNDSRHLLASHLINLAKTDKTGMLDLIISSMFFNLNIDSNVEAAVLTTPVIPADTQSAELNKMIANAYSHLPRQDKESQHNYDQRVYGYVSDLLALCKTQRSEWQETFE